MQAEVQAPTAAQWPDLSSWPADDAPPIEWARFYRDRCGWIVLPTASHRDVLAHARSIAVKEAAEFALEESGSVDAPISDEMQEIIWDRARELAEAGLG